MYYIGYNYYYTYLILPFSYNGVTPLAKFILFPHYSLYDNLLSTLLIKQFVDELDYFSYLSDGARNSRKTLQSKNNLAIKNPTFFNSFHHFQEDVFQFLLWPSFW